MNGQREHVVKARITRKRQLRADPNPLPDVQVGDRVTWVFAEDLGPSLRVVFKEIHPLRGSREPIPLASRLGPFKRLTKRGNRITGIVREPLAGRFIYEVTLDGKKIGWAVHLDKRGNFGGMDPPKSAPEGRG